MGNEYENLKKQRYLQLVQQCTRSGKSKREWCRENGVKYSTFMRWQRQLREELAGEILAGRTGRGNSGRAGDRTGTGGTAGTGFAAECRNISGEFCICGLWRRDRDQHREHPYPSAKGYAGKLSGQPGERTSLRCWETSGRQRRSTSSAGIQICGRD